MNLFAAFRRFFHFVKHLSNIAFIYFSPTVYFVFRSFGMFDDFFTKSFLLIFCHTLSGLKPKEDRLGSDSQAVFGL